MRAPPEPVGGVDLSLAVNYLPGCVCLAKSSLLSAWLCLLDTYAVYPGLFGTVLSVMLDRLGAPPRIFDGNSVLLAICAAHIAYTLQRHCPHAWVLPNPLYLALHCAWAAFAGWAGWGDLARGQRAKPHEYCARGQALCQERRALELVTGFMGLIVFFLSPGEPLALRFTRYVGFTVLCIGWVYAVAIRHGRLQRANDCGARFAVYFSPALYAPPPLAALYALLVVLACLSCLAPPAPAPRDPEAGLPPEVQPSASAQDRESLEELERVFRQAQQARAAAAS
jgi:hypothetical protein